MAKGSGGWRTPSSGSGGSGGGGGGLDPRKAQDMQAKLMESLSKAQEDLANSTVEATAGGGMVTVKMDGQKNVLGVKIDPEVAGDVEMLQDMVVAACNEAIKKVEDEAKQKMGGLLGGMGLPPGMF